MKVFVSRLILSFGLFVTCGVAAHSITLPANDPPGISFFKGSWKDALAEAKRQNKPIFLDVYTSWCPPCKRMAKEAFPNPKVGATFNVHFINYQLDAEKGEGIQIAKRYAVASYPTALYITPNGGLAYRAVGYSGINGMIIQADHMLDLPQLRTTVAKGDNDFVDGRRNPGFLKKYVKARQTLNRPAQDVLDAYLAALPEPERSTTETITFVAGALESSDTRAFDFLIKNMPSLLAPDLTKQSQAKTIFSALYRVLANDIQQATMTNDEQLVEKVIVNSERTVTSENPLMIRTDAQKQETANEYRLTFFRHTRNFEKYQAIAGSVAQDQLMHESVAGLSQHDSVGWKIAHSLYEIAKAYRELGSLPADWEPALTWIERSIALNRTHEYLNTYAQLLQKLGRKDEALNAQNEAIREAEKTGGPTDAYESELAEMGGK